MRRQGSNLQTLISAHRGNIKSKSVSEKSVVVEVAGTFGCDLSKFLLKKCRFEPIFKCRAPECVNFQTPSKKKSEHASSFLTRTIRATRFGLEVIL